ncbi:MAG: PAS domain S-box protein [Clostridiales bacterium]|nr:PAS domain S-box protein [Clostridiales bacterium]
MTEVNEGTARILGYSQEEIIGMAWENFVADDWVDRASKEIEKRKLGIANRYSMQLKKRDGSPIWVLASSSPLIDENGNYNGTLSAFKDITEQKLAKEKLVEGEKKALKLVAELEEVDRNKNEFLSILSHELRNPLAAIKGGIKILELKAKDEEVLKITEILNRQTDHLSNLVNDLLDITRINKNKLILNKEQVKLNNIVINVITDMELQFSNKKIKLYENICKEELYVEADPVRITQCIGNVLGNALKFTNENGNVWVSLHIEAGFGVINIKDDGIGISQEAIDRIFEPFKQELRHVKSHNNRGLGLGLSLVREIIQMHGGDVSVISKGLGQGALFTMRIPLVDNSK